MLNMRKLFSQKSKQKGYTGSSLVVTLSSMTKDEEKHHTDLKVNSASCDMQSTSMKHKPRMSSETSPTTQTSILNRMKPGDLVEKSKKLFVVVSDVDSTLCTPIIPTERTDCRLLSVDECEVNESNITLPYRSRSSTCSGQHSMRSREQNPKKLLEERLRRRSWVVFQTNNCQASDTVLQSQQTTNFLRLRRFRLGQSEPNLSSLQMSASHPTSVSVKTSPRTSSATTTNTLQFLARRSSTRRPNLSSMNLINLKHALRKQLSPQQLSISAGTSDPMHDSNSLDDNINRRWSLTSAPSSSGYGTTSPPSSQYSSFERLQHQQHICTCRQLSDPSSHDDLQRLESRSISMSLLDASISSTPNKMFITPDQDTNTMAFIYKERYPKAKVQMEERLQNFIDTYKVIDKFDYCSDGSARFIHNQIVELAKDCLQKSHNDLLTTLYFNEMNDNLERLLLNANEKCPQAIENLQTVVRKLLFTTARSARLLECLHFDPETFLRTLEEVECQAKAISNFKHDIPKYICSKLNLERNPLDVIDILQTSESRNSEEKNSSSEDNKSDSLAELNYLTITPNSTFPVLENSSPLKGPCEEDFEILKLISNGAYGAVHLIKHRQTHERYAMKKISKTRSVLRNQIEQVFVERDIMTFTDNPFVVALICTFETKNHLCLVMEYVEGGDVATLLKNIGGPLNIDIARMYFAETTLAVEYLHSYGVIHRDLKPDNLLITSVGHIKLTDFGLSKIGLMSVTTNFYEKLIDKETKTFNDKQICGTPTYIAPEVILRQGYGKPVDWWSMGIILYEFLVGSPPFTGNTPDELFANVINGEIDWGQLTTEIDEESSEEVFCLEARNLIEQLLVHDPGKRLGSLGGSYEIRTHSFCSCINWHSLLREKADFVPVLESMDDTSYFDTRKDRYKHSDDDEDDEDPLSTSATNNESDSLFASFSSVSLKYASELSGTHKQRHSSKQENDSASSTEISRANSCSDSLSSNSIIRIDSQSLLMTQSMTDEKVDSLDSQPKFGSDSFEPLLVSSDESESSSKKFNSSSSSLSSSQKLLNTDEKKPALSSIRHYKQRKTSLKLLGQQEAVDSGDDNHQEINKQRYHKKSRIPRALSPIQFKQNSLAAPTVFASSNKIVQRSSSLLKPVKYSNQQPQQRPFPRSLSKSFSSSSSSSSPPSTSFTNQDDRLYRQTHRHNMAVSPLERDTTLKAQQQSSYSSSSLSPICSITNNLRPPIVIRRGPRSFGFTLRAVKVFHGNTDYYTTQHVVISVQGPAEEAGLRPNDVITHVNERPVSGLVHSEVVKLILSGSQRLSIRAISCSEALIRIGGRRRSPSKQKNRFPQQSEKKCLTPVDDHHRHQTSCQKHRVNSSLSNPLNGNGNNSNKKHQHNNTSLFRRLSERKVARDIEAAAAAAAGISLTIPATSLTTNKNNSNSNNHTDASSVTTTNALSSSLPLLTFSQSVSDDENNSELSLTLQHQHHLDSSEWPPLISELDVSQPTLLPVLVKQTSQTFTSPSDEPARQSICRVPSDPPHSSRHSSTTSSSQVQFTFRQNNYPDQNYLYAPMLSTRKKKLVRQKPVNNTPSVPSRLQSLFIRENNLNCNVQTYRQDPLTRSLSMESSTMKTTDQNSSSPVVVSTRFFY